MSLWRRTDLTLLVLEGSDGQSIDIPGCFPLTLLQVMPCGNNSLNPTTSKNCFSRYSEAGESINTSHNQGIGIGWPAHWTSQRDLALYPSRERGLDLVGWSKICSHVARYTCSDLLSPFLIFPTLSLSSCSFACTPSTWGVKCCMIAQYHYGFLKEFEGIVIVAGRNRTAVSLQSSETKQKTGALSSNEGSWLGKHCVAQ